MDSIIMMLKAVLALLIAVTSGGVAVPEQIRDQAIEIAQQAIATATSEGAKIAVQQTISIPQQVPTQTLPAQNNTTTMTDPAPASQARIEIVSPLSGKGLGRKYTSDPNNTDDRNYIELGAVLYNDDGSVNQTADMTVGVTGPSGSSNKVINGTGNFAGYLKVFYYPFHLDFTEAGDYTVTFTANGKTASVQLHADAPQN